jgi:hypothetical protein
MVPLVRVASSPPSQHLGSRSECMLASIDSVKSARREIG